MAKRKGMLPREHGAWVMLYAPFVIGAAHGGGWSLDLFWTFLLITGGFCAREPMTIWWTRKNQRAVAGWWLVGFAALVCVGGVGLATHERRTELATLVVLGGLLWGVHFLLARRREHRGFFGELLGIAGLALSAPLGYFSAEGNESRWAALLWLLNLLYFGSSVVYVKWRVARLAAARRGETTREGLGALVAYHVVLVGVLAGLVAFDRVSGWVFVAFAPLGCRYTLERIVRQAPTLTQIGVSEILFSLVFVGVMLWMV